MDFPTISLVLLSMICNFVKKSIKTLISCFKQVAFANVLRNSVLRNRLYHTLCICVCLLFCALLTNAQNKNGHIVQTNPNYLEFADRFAFRINAVEWLMTIPNFQVAFDLKPSVYNREVLLLGLKYNWSTFHNYAPSYVFDLFDFRPEYRWYYRERKDKKPDPWKAYYIGLYSDFFSCDFKARGSGYDGTGGGIGISTGYEIPLHQFDRGAVDFDLGLSAGWVLSSGNHGLQAGGINKVLLLPMITELRAGFSWRHTSVEYRYNKIDPALIQYRITLSDIDDDIRRSSLEAFKEIEGQESVAKYEADLALYKHRYFESLKDTEEYVSSRIEQDAIMTPRQKDALKRYLHKKIVMLQNEFLSSTKEQ